MSKPITTPFTFQTQPGPIPLSQLDTDFLTAANAINDFATYSNYLTDTSGAPNQITVTIPVGATFSYSAGVKLEVLLANTNTATAVQINASGLGNKAVQNVDGTAPAVGQLIAGMILQLQYNGTVFLLTGAASKPVPVPPGVGSIIAAVKTSSQNVNNSTVVVADTALALALPIGTYAVQLWVQPFGVAGGGFKYQLTQTSGTIAMVGGGFGTNGSINGANSITGLVTPLGFNNAFGGISSTNVDWIMVTTTVVVSVAGTLTFSWAQQVATVGNTTVGAGSWMMATKLL
jgi:hypothetical protein